MSITYDSRIVTTTPYQIVLSDEIILVNVSIPSSIKLPIISDGDRCSRGYYIKDYSGLSATNTITITAPPGKTIDGAPFAILNSGYAHVQVIYDGKNWKIIS